MIQHSRCDFRPSTFLMYLDCSYQPAISSTYNPSNEMGTITTDSGGSITGRFVGEICMLKSATSALNFTYNASRTFARTYLILCPTSASCSPLDRPFSDE